MNIQTVDSLNSGRYTAQAAAKSVVGCGSPEFNIEHSRAHAVFLCKMHCYTQIMVGRAGQLSGWPGSMLTGTSTPVRLTTNKCGSFGGEFSEFNIEVATMATTLTQTQPEITLVDGRAVTTSIALADYFTKRHDDVLKKIRILDCSPEFNARNFAAVEYTDAKGEQRPAYHITRDGFAFLAMGFTGKRAAIFKENYIIAFNKMEARLYAGPDLSSVTHNATVLARYLQIINEAWRESLYPMLAAARSPLAVELHDRIQDAGFISALVAKSLGRSS